MGPVFADIDGDGRLDLWVTDSKYNRLMRNAGQADSKTSARAPEFRRRPRNT